jgi:outer membrane protein OmpA-like peptidoglycan-associated protein
LAYICYINTKDSFQHTIKKEKIIQSEGSPSTDLRIPEDKEEKITLEPNITLSDSKTVVNIVKSVIKEQKVLAKKKPLVTLPFSCKKEFRKILHHKKIYFSYNNTQIKRSSYRLLNTFARIAKKCPKSRVIIEGYSDSRGKKAYNRKLSRQRAKAVKRYLVHKGIAPRRLKTKGYGEAHPIATNRTKKGRRLNRRIEFKIKGFKK